LKMVRPYPHPPFKYGCNRLICSRYMCFQIPDDGVFGTQGFVMVQVFVVRQDLKMGSGKIASQCARKINFRNLKVMYGVSSWL
jgi:hypothetical protein